MAYLKSASRKEFEQIHLSLVEQVRHATAIKNLRSDLVQCIYNNAIFRMSAAFEDYIKTVLEDWIDMLDKNNGCLTHLPGESVSYSLFKRQEQVFLKFILNGAESAIISDLNNNKEYTKKFFLHDSPVKGLINFNQLVMDKKYPSKKNLRQLFNRFGFKDIFKDMAARGRKDYTLLLQSFSDSRTELAHSFTSINMSKSSVIKNLDNVYELVNVIDRLLYSHVCRVSGGMFWKSSYLPV